jgi:hypothetical protein
MPQSFIIVNLKNQGAYMGYHYKVEKHYRYKSRWICWITEPGCPVPTDFDRCFTSKKKAENFGKWACEKLAEGAK